MQLQPTEAVRRWAERYRIRANSSPKRVFEPKTPKLLDEEGGRSLANHVTNETNIEITLEHPTTIVLAGIHPKGGEHSVQRIYLWADDPKGFLDAVREQIS